MLASGAILGVIAGLVVGRNWRPLAAAHVLWLPLLVAGLFGRAVAPFVPGLAFVLYVFALASTVAVAVANVRLTGALLIAIGGGLNLAVVLLNGGMPVDPAAALAAGAAIASDALHVPLTESTQLKALADVIAVPIFRAVYSVGDLFIAAGGFVVPFVLLTRR